jgi:hypothetical protein
VGGGQTTPAATSIPSTGSGQALGYFPVVSPALLLSARFQLTHHLALSPSQRSLNIDRHLVRESPHTRWHLWVIDWTHARVPLSGISPATRALLVGAKKRISGLPLDRNNITEPQAPKVSEIRGGPFAAAQRGLLLHDCGRDASATGKWHVNCNSNAG